MEDKQMIIRNKTDIDLMVNHNYLYPNKEHQTPEYAFNTVYVLSHYGSVEITTEYSERSFMNYGNLYGEECEDIDDQGLKVIEIHKV